MTHRTRSLRVDAITRVEGEGALDIEIDGDTVVAARLNIYEPPRFFEALLRGRHYTEPVDITARICGICPVAYQMSACLAIEDACGVEVDEPIQALRRLIYCGEWIESHTLHVAMLHAPDLLGYPGGIEMARDHREVVQLALDLKQAGNELIELIGGRAIHPVNVRVGGFYRVPTVGELRPLRARLARALEQAETLTRWAASLPFPDAEHHHELAALHDPDRYAILGGRLVTDTGLDISAAQLPEHIAEEQVAHSTALHARFLDRGNYLVGPMARFVLNHDQLAPRARAAAAAAGVDATCRNPHRSIVMRACEIVHALETALAIIDEYERPARAATPVEPRAGVGHGWTEAPRGMLYHRYEIDADGIIRDAVIVPPTSQNQATIEHELFHLVEANLDLDDDALTFACERLIRTFDPCISCATHFLDVSIRRT